MKGASLREGIRNRKARDDRVKMYRNNNSTSENGDQTPYDSRKFQAQYRTQALLKREMMVDKQTNRC